MGAITVLGARYPIARGTVAKFLERWNHQMSVLADVLLKRKKMGATPIHAGNIYTSLLSV